MSNLVEVLKDTLLRCNTDAVLMDSIAKTKSAQRVYLENESIEHAPFSSNSFSTQIIVSTKRSFEAAESYCKASEKVAVLNFANSFNPGGGVLLGARAQEESLCRISTLYPALIDETVFSAFYGRHRNKLDNFKANDDIIYSPHITVFKDDNSLELLKKEDWYTLNVITCAAPDLNDGTIRKEELRELFTKRWRRILEVAQVNDCTVVILGAFGCGAFRNPSDLVANSAKAVLSEFQGSFKTVEFAVACQNDWTNYNIFKNVLNS